jgi:hypothetical protein
MPTPDGDPVRERLAGYAAALHAKGAIRSQAVRRALPPSAATAASPASTAATLAEGIDPMKGMCALHDPERGIAWIRMDGSVHVAGALALLGSVLDSGRFDLGRHAREVCGRSRW